MGFFGGLSCWEFPPSISTHLQRRTLLLQALNNLKTYMVSDPPALGWRLRSCRSLGHFSGHLCLCLLKLLLKWLCKCFVCVQWLLQVCRRVCIVLHSAPSTAKRFLFCVVLALCFLPHTSLHGLVFFISSPNFNL